MNGRRYRGVRQEPVYFAIAASPINPEPKKNNRDESMFAKQPDCYTPEEYLALEENKLAYVRLESKTD